MYVHQAFFLMIYLICIIASFLIGRTTFSMLEIAKQYTIVSTIVLTILISVVAMATEKNVNHEILIPLIAVYTGIGGIKPLHSNK